MSETSTIRLTGPRGATARKMLESMSSTAQLSFHSDCRATALVEKRAAWKAAGEDVGYDDLLLYALARVLGEHRPFNAIERENGLELRSAVDVSYAVAVSGQLLAPVIRSLGGKTVVEIAAARRALVAKARSGQLTVSDMTGGSFTLSSLGQTRIRYFTPILNHPQKAILGVGRIEKRALVDPTSNQILAADVVGLSLTVDHRWIDGHPAGEFLTALCAAVECNLPGPS